MPQQEGDQPRQRIFTPRPHSLPRAPSALEFASRRRCLTQEYPLKSLWSPHLRPGAAFTEEGSTALRTSCWHPDLDPQGFSALTSITAHKLGYPPVEISADHHAVVDKLLGELEVAFTTQEFWVVNVPSSSEQIAAHRAWDRRTETDPDGVRREHWVEPEYRARLRAAYLLLVAGIARYVFISGGEVDTEACSNEGAARYPNIDALFGKREFLDLYEDHWRTRVPEEIRRDRRTIGTHAHAGRLDELEDRILVDPYALHTETNIRNCDRFCASVGLDRNLIATTFGLPARTPIGTLHGNFGQGDFIAGFWPNLPLIPPPITFHGRYVKRVNFVPGVFTQLRADRDIHNERCPAGQGIFGTGLSAFTREGRVVELDPALDWIPFVMALHGGTPSPEEYRDWSTGVILHHKFLANELLADKRFDDTGN